MANVIRFIGLMFLSLLILQFLGTEKSTVVHLRIAKISLLIYQGQIWVIFKVFLFWLLILMNHICILSHLANFKTFPNDK